jgi:uncharacterized protein YndB with AHSA1/START domain
MILLLAAVATAAADKPPVRTELEPLAFLVGHCWRGEFKSGEQDTHCFEPAFDGQHIRDRHEVTGGKGVYRGETLYSWNGKAVEFTYWNSSGGVSRGTMKPEPGRLAFDDQLYRSPNGKEMRISTFWRPVDADSYETVTNAGADPTGSRVVRYTRLASPPVQIGRSRAPDGSHILTHEAVVAAEAKQVWEAIASAEGWKSWAVPAAWASPQDPDILETSYNPAAAPGHEGNIKQRFLARVPGRLLAFRTIQAPKGFPDFDSYARVTSLFELEPLPGGRTRVRLTGAGYPDTEAGRRLLAFFEQGNAKSLEWLQARFTSGPADWKKRLAATK